MNPVRGRLPVRRTQTGGRTNHDTATSMTKKTNSTIFDVRSKTRPAPLEKSRPKAAGAAPSAGRSLTGPASNGMKTSKRSIIITGVSSGLGKAFFDLLIEKDVFAYCLSRRFLPYQTELSKSVTNVALKVCDLRNTDEVISCASEMLKELKDSREIVFINNAGTIEPVGPVGKITDSAIVDSMHVNAIGPMLIINALCRLPGNSVRTILHIGTGAAHTPIAGWSLYCSAKSAMHMFLEVLKEQYAKEGIVKIYECDPGTMDTSMQEKIRQSSTDDFPRIEEFKDLKKGGQLSDPRVIAEKLVYEYLHL